MPHASSKFASKEAPQKNKNWKLDAAIERVSLRNRPQLEEGFR
jgi:hypothetical protein